MPDLSAELYNSIRRDALPTKEEVDGRHYTVRDIKPVYDPTPSAFVVNTLTGLVDYLKINVDKLDLDSLICHVVSPETVSVFSALHGNFQQRSEYVRAKLDMKGFEFDDYLSPEEFNIGLQSCFTDTPLTVDGELKPTDKGLVLKYVGNVKESVVKESGDDGVSQRMAVKIGIAAIEDVVLPNPVTLRPYRTFNEVEQPASAFVFRACNGPKFGLWEADNGAWKGAAMKNIKAFLEFKLHELHVIA